MKIGVPREAKSPGARILGSAQVGAHTLESAQGGRGVLMSGASGVYAAEVELPVTGLDEVLR